MHKNHQNHKVDDYEDYAEECTKKQQEALKFIQYHF